MGVIYTLSPLLVWSTAAMLVSGWLAARSLPDGERRMFSMILVAGVIVRAAAVAAIALGALPELNDLAVGTLAGDEGYNLARSLRARDILLGFPTSHYDHFVATDEYGRSSYLTLITWLQLAAGPSPFGLRLINLVLFALGAVLLHRLIRAAFGGEVALVTLAAVLFLPTLLLASIALLKESLYFAFVATFLASAWYAALASSMRTRVLWIGLLVVAIIVLDDLRRGGAALAIASLVLAAAIRLVLVSTRRVVAATALAAVIAVIALSRDDNRAFIARQVEQVAVVHAGNVFTIGRPYKLLDEGFYVNPRSPASALNLTFEQAVRFVVNAAVAFVVVPAPWQSATRADLVYLPQQLLWYAALILLPIGLLVCWQRNATLTALLASHLAITSAALMFTNGNIGTLVRLRGLIWPYVLCIAAAGALALRKASRADVPAIPERAGDAAH